MRRTFTLIGLLGLLAAPLLTACTPAHQPTPAFIEADEHGFDPYTSLCRHQTAAEVATANVPVISNDGVVQVGSNRGCIAPQNEPAIAVDPNDPQLLVAGSNDYRLCCDSESHNDGTGWAYASRDGGRTWSNSLLPALTRETGGWGTLAHTDSAGDPAVAFTSNGAALYANIAFARNSDWSAITLNRSPDAGRHWQRPTVLAQSDTAGVFLDKTAIAAGPHGVVAVTFTRFASDGFLGTATVEAVVSRNGGRTWSKPIAIAPAYSIAQGTAPAFAANGRLYVAFETASLATGSDEIAVAESADLTRFSVRELARAYDECYPQNSDGRSTLTGENFRVDSFPAIAVDQATGTAAVAWADDEHGCGETASDSQVKLVLVHGTHAHGPYPITRGGDKAFPAVAYHDGVVTVSFYTRDFADYKNGIDYAYATSADGWLERRLSDGSSNPFMQFAGAFIGDYTGLVVGPDGVAHAIWTDSRGGDQNIYSQAFTP